MRTQAEALNLRPLAETWETRLRALATEGLTVWEDDRVHLSPRGMLLSNGIFGMFV